MKKNIEVTSLLGQVEFGERFKKFRKKYDLSLGNINSICENSVSKSSLQRLQFGQADPGYYAKAIINLETYIEKWMIEQNHPESLIEETLNHLFPHRKDIDMIVNRCELTANAVKFFGLKTDPFDVDRVPGEDEFFSFPALDELITRVSDAVLYKRFVCVIGPVGSGKTTVKHQVGRTLTKSVKKVHLIHPEFYDMSAVTVGAIASSILEHFDVKVPTSSTKRVTKIRQLLSSLNEDDERVALIFDECHRLNERVITSLKNFWEMTNGGYSRLMSLILFGQPKFVESVLREVKFREVTERVQVLEMPSIEKAARDYLAHRISIVGGDIESLFEAKAIQRICNVAKTPLSLGNLANTALMEAFKLEEKQVASNMLKLPDSPTIRGMRIAA